jgi:hypothetical protein
MPACSIYDNAVYHAQALVRRGHTSSGGGARAGWDEVDKDDLPTRATGLCNIAEEATGLRRTALSVPFWGLSFANTQDPLFALRADDAKLPLAPQR